MLFQILDHAHSGLRWIVLILLLINVSNAFKAWRSNRTVSAQDVKLSLFGMISVHIQALLGIILYFQSPNVHFGPTTMSNAHIRFFTIEHVFGMLIAIVLITIGYRKDKNAATGTGKVSTVFWYYLIALLIILISIPWPFRGFGNGWF